MQPCAKQSYSIIFIVSCSFIWCDFVSSLYRDRCHSVLRLISTAIIILTLCNFLIFGEFRNRETQLIDRIFANSFSQWTFNSFKIDYLNHVVCLVYEFTVVLL